MTPVIVYLRYVGSLAIYDNVATVGSPLDTGPNPDLAPLAAAVSKRLIALTFMSIASLLM